MKKILLIAAALSANSVIADEYQEFTQQSQAAIKEFAGTLKGALVASMKSSGPVEAINVCNMVAPTIASELSKKYGMELKHDAAAVMTHGPPAGEPILPGVGPSLPAATTVKTPALVAAIKAISSGAVILVMELPTE